ncbi:MAG: SPFH domain-containing protein [Candidatus Aphodosoma sp.]
MALIDIVQYQNKDGELCHKFEANDLNSKTQLIVHPSQTAIFVKGGKICDEFTSGTYTLETQNIPILNNIVNLPFGSETPFTAEVWFINQTATLNIPWGTPNHIFVEDPRYHIIVPIGAHGQYGLKVTNPKLFLETLIGNLSSFSTAKIEQFYKGKLITSLNTLISQQIVNQKISVLDINTQLLAMSEIINNRLNEIFDKYGVSIIEFSIMSINCPKDDESIKKLKETKDFAARINITGKDVYQMERSFDVLETAAKNESTGGQMLGVGVGLGVGAGVGGAIGNMAGQYINTNPVNTGAVPPLPQSGPLFYIAINGQQIPNLTIEAIANYIKQGVANSSTLAWTAGMTTWLPISQIPALASLVNNITPPPLP